MPLLAVDKAVTRILKGVKPTRVEKITLENCSGRILAADLKSKRHQPPFAASAMDGYAVKAIDIIKVPASLQIIGEAPAGHQFMGTVGRCQTVRIFTGAPLPRGADTVIMQENSKAQDGVVTILQSEQKGKFVRPAGLDFKKGETVMRANTVLNARSIGLCAAMNYASVPVYRKPTIAILSTGDELVEPGGKPGPDKIISSNSVALAAAVSSFGGEPLNLGIVPDNLEKIIEAINCAKKADVLITIGGASVGDHDLIGPAFKKLGIKMDFWKIAMRPGKPMIFAKRGKQRILGLPGNPVSSLVCALVYLKPLINKMVCQPTTIDDTVKARLTTPLPANDLRQDYIRATLSRNDKGHLLVTPFSKQDSSMQKNFARADALIIRPPHANHSRAGASVAILPINF